MNPEGTASHLNSAENKAIYAIFRGMVDDGTALMPDSKTETGPTWTGYFPKGKIGIMPMPASLQGMANAALADADIGVAPIAGVKGGTSTFIGGDAIGIPAIARSPTPPGTSWLGWKATTRRSTSSPKAATCCPDPTSPTTSTARRTPALCCSTRREERSDPLCQELRRNV